MSDRKVWPVWIDDNGSYERHFDVIDAFETKAQAYAHKERIEKMLAAAKRRVDRYFATEGSDPPVHRGRIGKLVSRFGVNARVWVHPLTVKRGVTPIDLGNTLTAPRWTLDRLLSEPPEGWRVAQDKAGQDHGVVRAIFCWGSASLLREGEVVTEVTAWADHREMFVWPNVEAAKERRKLPRLAERHKAAAELALILAEVEP